MIPLYEPLHRVLCYSTIPGAGFHAGCGRNCLPGWVYGDVRWVTNQQKSCRQVKVISACLWNGPHSGVAAVLVFLWYQIQWVAYHTVFPIKTILQKIGLEILLGWRPGKYKGKFSVSAHQLTSLVSVWDRAPQGYEIWSGMQVSACFDFECKFSLWKVRGNLKELPVA